MFKALEIIWLVIGLVGVAMCAYSITAGRRQDAIYFLVVTFMSGVMYAVRKRQRKKAEEYSNEKKD